MEDNFVKVTPIADDQVRLSTSDHYADVNPTPVAKLQGSHSYETGTTSSFIGSGSAGDVSRLNAGLDVDFNTGSITNGSLQLQAGDQTWSLDA